MAGSYFQHVPSLAAFHAQQMQKRDCIRSERLLVGLNCFSRGQTQRAHAHGAADKFYLVLSGKARITVGTEVREAGPGTLAWAPAGVSHAVDEALEDAVVLVVMAPPPRAESRVETPSGPRD